MFVQLLIGSIIIAVSITLHAIFIALAIKVLRQWRAWIASPPLFVKMLFILTATTLWMLAAHSLTVWLWAFLFLFLGIFNALEPAVYFSLVAFTTLGFGDIILAEEWRILSGMAATNGLLLFGFSTAFLFEVIARFHRER